MSKTEASLRAYSSSAGGQRWLRDFYFVPLTVSNYIRTMNNYEYFISKSTKGVSPKPKTAGFLTKLFRYVRQFLI